MKLASRHMVRCGVTRGGVQADGDPRDAEKMKRDGGGAVFENGLNVT